MMANPDVYVLQPLQEHLVRYNTDQGQIDEQSTFEKKACTKSDCVSDEAEQPLVLLTLIK